MISWPFYTWMSDKEFNYMITQAYDFYYLNNDCDGVAIYTNLEETTEIQSKVFETVNKKLINLYFKHNTDIS